MKKKLGEWTGRRRLACADPDPRPDNRRAPVANDEAAQEQAAGAAGAAADWQPDESNEENGDAVEA
ncbi:amidase signature domain-containing protein [Apiospora arundinis]